MTKRINLNEDELRAKRVYTKLEVKKNMRISKLEELAIAYKDNQVEI